MNHLITITTIKYKIFVPIQEFATTANLPRYKPKMVYETDIDKSKCNITPHSSQLMSDILNS